MPKNQWENKKKKIISDIIVKSFEDNMCNINKIELYNRIEDFRKLNFKELTDNEILTQLNSLLLFNGELKFLGTTLKYKKGSLFYRARKIREQDIYLLRKTDFWNAPKEVITKYGRLNAPQESLLYTSPNVFISYSETNIREGEYFLIIIYEARKDVQANFIGGEIDYNKIKITNKDAILTHKILNDFLITEFTRDVGIGTEYLYKLSGIISKTYFNLKQPIQDAWAYPSIKDKNEVNVCFKPEIAKEILDLKCGLIFRNDFPSDFPKICAIQSITYDFGENGTGRAFHCRPGSDIQKNIFSQLNFQLCDFQ